jgi:hypothetical protein
MQYGLKLYEDKTRMLILLSGLHWYIAVVSKVNRKCKKGEEYFKDAPGFEMSFYDSICRNLRT